MAVREVLLYPDPRLKQVCPPAQPDEAERVAADLLETMRDFGHCVGIAAPQIGTDVRVVHLDLGEPWTLVNPRIIGHSDESWVLWDACLSVSVAFFGQVT